MPKCYEKTDPLDCHRWSDYMAKRLLELGYTFPTWAESLVERKLLRFDEKNKCWLITDWNDDTLELLDGDWIVEHTEGGIEVVSEKGFSQKFMLV